MGPVSQLLLCVAVIILFFGMMVGYVLGMVSTRMCRYPCRGRFLFEAGQPALKEAQVFDVPQFTNEERVPITVTPKTPGGKLSVIQPGTLKVEVVEGEGTFEIVNDGLFYVISPDILDETPQTLYRVTGDADLGEGVKELVDFVRITVGPAVAESFGFSAGAPETKL